MISIPAFIAFGTYFLMLLAYRYHHIRGFHLPVMMGIILFDLGMPFYLYSTRDWHQQLIVDGDILSFIVWMHFGLIMTLYTFYFLQIWSGIKQLKNDESVRESHSAQAKGILITRALVILSGWMIAGG